MSHRSTAFVFCATLDCGECVDIEFEGQHISKSQITEGVFKHKWGRVGGELACRLCISNALKNLKRELADYGSDAVVVYTDLFCDGENCGEKYGRMEPNKEPQRDVRMARPEASVEDKWRHRRPNFDFCPKCDAKLQAWSAEQDRQIDERKRAESQLKARQLPAEREAQPLVDARSGDPDEAKILKVINLENTQFSPLWPEEQYRPADLRGAERDQEER